MFTYVRISVLLCVSLTIFMTQGKTLQAVIYGITDFRYIVANIEVTSQFILCNFLYTLHFSTISYLSFLRSFNKNISIQISLNYVNIITMKSNFNLLSFWTSIGIKLSPLPSAKAIILLKNNIIYNVDWLVTYLHLMSDN